MENASKLQPHLTVKNIERRAKKIVIRILLFYALKERILRLVEGTPQKCALKIRVFLLQKKRIGFFNCSLPSLQKEDFQNWIY